MSLHEKISSLCDDELDISEHDQVLSSLKQNESHKQIWGRYCIIGDAMRGNLPDNPKHDLFSRVQLALESEPALLVPTQREEATPKPSNVVELAQKPAKEPFFRPVAGLAVAASVALASVLGFQIFSSPGDGVPPSSIASTIIDIPKTQELNLSPVNIEVANTAVSPTEEIELVSSKGNVIFAQQSLIDDGQWTRITRIGNILLDNNTALHPPHVLESRQTVDFNKGIFPFASAASLEDVQVE